MTAGKERTIPWSGKQTKSQMCYFYVPPCVGERYQNFWNYQCASTLGGVSKEPETSGALPFNDHG